MLSKSTAHKIFLLGGLLSALFIAGLSVHTVWEISERTGGDLLSPSVRRGRAHWDANNCMGCHGILGEGGYYAPELTLVYKRRGPEYLRSFLANPGAMSGKRKMVNYKFKAEEIEELIAFFQWVGGLNLNGYPSRPNLQFSRINK